MKLLSFAHKNEALYFFESEVYKAVPELQGLYKCPDHYILICGEGLIPALGQINKAFSLINYKFNERISRHINMGLCGGLRASIEIEKIYRIRSIYAEKSINEMHFQSYHTNTKDQNKGLVDLVSACDRVKNEGYKQSLSAFAHLVDREAWSLARASQEFKVSFECYKLVSDFAGDDTNCFDIQEQAHKYSKKLYDFYKVLIGKNKIEASQLTEDQSLQIDLSDFHITKAHSIKLNKLLHSAVIAFSKPQTWVYQQLPLEDIKKAGTAKQRTSLLIFELECLLNPVKKQITKKLNKILASKPKNITVSYDPEFENTELNINIKVRTENQKKQVSEYIQSLPIEKIQRLLNGDDYVI